MIKSNLKFIPASEYCESVFDGTHDTPKPTASGFKLLTSKHILNNKLDVENAYYISEEDYKAINKRSQVSQWDVLFSMIGTVGTLCLVSQKDIDFAIKNIGVFSCKDEAKARFLYYYLSSPYSKKIIENYLNGAVQKFLSLEMLRNFPVPEFNEEYLPMIDLLSSLDKKIECNNQLISELESLAKTIYDYWFLQFEFPNEEGKPYKSSGGKMIWSEELKREIPEGWGVDSIMSMIRIDKGGDWGEGIERGNYNYKVTCIRGTDFPSITYTNKLNAPTRFILEKNKSKTLAENDILIEISGGSKTQSTGRICYVNTNLLKRFNTPVITSNFCKAISLKSRYYTYYFYLMWLRLYDNNFFFNYEGKTSGIKNLLFERVCSDYLLPIPPNDILMRFDNLLRTIFDTIQIKNLESQHLIELRDYLLPMLMNGQVGFKEGL